MHINILKIVIHKAEDKDTVFLFTSLKLNAVDFLSISLNFPSGEGEAWVQAEIGTTTYEVVRQGFEVCAPA